MATPFFFFARNAGQPAPGLSPVFLSIQSTNGSPTGFFAPPLPTISELKSSSGTGSNAGHGWYWFIPSEGRDWYGVVDLGASVSDPKERYLDVRATAADKPERDTGLLVTVNKAASATNANMTILSACTMPVRLTMTLASGGAAQMESVAFGDLSGDSITGYTFCLQMLTGAAAGKTFALPYIEPDNQGGLSISYDAGVDTSAIAVGDKAVLLPTFMDGPLKNIVPETVWRYSNEDEIEGTAFQVLSGANINAGNAANAGSYILDNRLTPARVAKLDNVAQVGSAMGLSVAERNALALAIQAALINETDGQQVLKAITDKIASVNPDLSGLTVNAIATAVWQFARLTDSELEDALSGGEDAYGIRGQICLARNLLDTVQYYSILGSDNSVQANQKLTPARLAKIDGAQQEGQNVTLPNPAPAGYGGGSSGATPAQIADAVVGHAAPGHPQGATIGEAITAGNLAAVDATQNTATLLNRITPERAGKLDKAQQNDAAVMLPTSAPAGYGGGLTSDQNTKLNDVSTKVTTLEGRLTATRAGFLDYLDTIRTGVNSLLGMTKVVSNVRQFLTSALSQAPSSSGSGSGGNVSDIFYSGASASQQTFPQAGRQVLAITINATGSDYPVRTCKAAMFVGTTSASATSPPAIEACQSVTPTGDGQLVKVLVMLGTPKGDETIPFFDLAPGTYKFWVWIDDGVEITPLSTAVVTVTA